MGFEREPVPSFRGRAVPQDCRPDHLGHDLALQAAERRVPWVRVVQPRDLPEPCQRA